MSTPKWQAWVIGGHVIRTCTSAAPASRTSFTSGPAVVPRTRESSIITTRSTFEVLAQRVELERDATIADVLRRFDECAADVAVLDQPVVEGDPALGRISDGGGDRGVGHGDDDVGLGRPLAGELDTELLADVVDVAAVPHRIRTTEVDELEGAARSTRLRGEHLCTVDLGAAQCDHLAGLHLVDVDTSECRKCTCLAGHRMPTVRQAAHREGSETPRVADGDHTVGGQDDQGERALPRRQGALDALFPGQPAGRGEHQCHHFGIAGGGEPESTIQQLLAQRRRVDHVAVVGQRERAVHRLHEERLDVAFGVGTGRRVPGVADGVIPDEWGKRLGAEDVGHEPDLLVHPRTAPVADGDAGGFLAPMLQCEETEERKLCDAVTVWCRYAQHPTLVLRGIVSGLLDVLRRQARHGQFRHDQLISNRATAARTRGSAG